jgi:hypothetical protein
MSNLPQTIDPAIARRLITQEERDQIRAAYASASSRSRQAIVASFLMHGMTTDRMAKILNVPLDVINRDYSDSVDQVRSGMDSAPEGPMMMSQIVIEGYVRYHQFVMSTIHDFISKHGDTEEGMKHVRPMLKLGLEVLDAATKRMERYGVLYVEEKGVKKLSGGVRVGEPADPEAMLHAMAASHGVNLKLVEQEIIDASIRED